MTLGYICNGPCGRFWEGRHVGAEITFLCFVDEQGHSLPSVTTQICPDCVVGLLATHGPQAAAARALHVDVDDDFKPKGE